MMGGDRKEHPPTEASPVAAPAAPAPVAAPAAPASAKRVNWSDDMSDEGAEAAAAARPAEGALVVLPRPAAARPANPPWKFPPPGYKGRLFGARAWISTGSSDPSEPSPKGAPPAPPAEPFVVGTAGLRNLMPWRRASHFNSRATIAIMCVCR